MKYRRHEQKKPPLPLIILAALAAIAVLAFLIICARIIRNLPQRPDRDEISVSQATTAPTEETTGPQVTATATVLSTGDLLMHKPVITAAKTEDGYDFSFIFKYIQNYVRAADYAVANLETTFGGPSLPYRGSPAFNCPDQLADAVKDAGFDMLLTANNHCGDTLSAGILRTLDQLSERGITALGTTRSSDDRKYTIADINGIRVGMLCYTYATDMTSSGKPQLNLGAFLDQAGLVNCYVNTKLDVFYQEVQAQLEEMKAQGVDATIFYIHWGPEEYKLTPNSTKQTLSQQLCNMGIDVIIGGHPHVVEPMALLTSTVDPTHKTVCLYSMGNAVSNQSSAIQEIAQVCPTGHTEDGVLFSVTFSKFSDGTVALTDTDLIPCWVDFGTTQKYTIIPLDPQKQSSWESLYALTDLSAAQRSFQRTNELVGTGLKVCQDYVRGNG